MGHIHIENIAKHLFLKLMNNWNKYEDKKEKCWIGLLDNPKLLYIKEEVEYFVNKIKLLKEAIDIVPFTKTKKEIKKLMYEKYALNCSDGNYLESDMIEMGICEYLTILKKLGYTQEIEKGAWIINYNKIKPEHFNTLIIKEIDL